jgi:hypothetical protein
MLQSILAIIAGFLIFIKPDIAAKRHKKHKNKISGLVISMGYEIEI